MSKATDIAKQIEKLQAEYDDAIKTERAAALIDVKAKIKLYGFNKRELGLPARVAKRAAG